MNEGEQLSVLVRALRRSRTGQHPDPDSSRGLILAAASARRKRSKFAVMVLLPIAATLVFSTAWGAGDLGRRGVWHAVVGRLLRSRLDNEGTGGTGEQRTSRGSRPGASPKGEVSAARLPPGIPVESLPAASRPVESLPEESLPVESAPVSSGSVRPPTKTAAAMTRSLDPDAGVSQIPSTDPAAVAVLAASPEAGASELPPPAPLRGHFHFVDHDPALALAVWDRYLAAKPTGAFAVEAKYNRVLCLIRLSRIDAARVALEPFTAGQFGVFWQEEAARLLARLDDP